MRLPPDCKVATRGLAWLVPSTNKDGTAMNSIPNDPALAGLAELLPAAGAPQFVLDAVRQMTGIAFSQGLLEYFEYRPARDARMLWSFPAESGPALLVSGKLFRDDDAGPLMEQTSLKELAKETAVRHRAQGSYYQYLPERRVLLQLFPFHNFNRIWERPPRNPCQTSAMLPPASAAIRGHTSLPEPLVSLSARDQFP